MDRGPSSAYPCRGYVNMVAVERLRVEENYFYFEHKGMMKMTTAVGSVCFPACLRSCVGRKVKG